MGKIILTETQLFKLSKSLKEQDSNDEFTIDYTPEKIDEFVKEAESVLDSVEKVFNMTKQKLVDVNIGSVVESSDEMKKLHEHLEKFHKNVESKNTKFYNIIEMYEIGEYPDNVKRLDELFSKIDHRNLDIYYLKDATTNILDVCETISKLD